MSSVGREVNIAIVVEFCYMLSLRYTLNSAFNFQLHFVVIDNPNRHMILTKMYVHSSFGLSTQHLPL